MGGAAPVFTFARQDREPSPVFHQLDIIHIERTCCALAYDTNSGIAGFFGSEGYADPLPAIVDVSVGLIAEFTYF